METTNIWMEVLKDQFAQMAQRSPIFIVFSVREVLMGQWPNYLALDKEYNNILNIYKYNNIIL